MATLKLTLFNAERDILVDVDVSAADAQRASTDTLFATQLLNKVLNEQPQTSTSADLADENVQFSDDGTDNFIDEEFLNTEDTAYSNSETQESEASLYRWSTPCVLLLLESYRSMENDFNSGKISQKKVWEKVAKELKVKGHDVTGPQCSSKLRSLKKSYKSIKDHNSKSGNDRRTWQFFDIMEEIFSKKAWCDPVAVASSTGLSKKQLESNDSMEGSDSGCSIKSNKTPIATLLGKRLKQKEEHEQQKSKRHKERMEMDEKFLNVLEKLANK
ncbi:hypothetical protein KQX54_009807 [Cotesia glomerata]|uniref:Myb/SANT-like DNA-binding domain-containing protein n=1 Tax=Cotesia glomerata TaxID=32391 RepID=A0AAV7IUA9_COTGL|nr:hypothetical protein KQX54_009807 [Cotesia glomerata]